MLEEINRGSEWNKWDLHIHSPLTWLENRYENDDKSIELFIGRIKAEDIKVVGLTNYFNFAEGEIEGDKSIKARLEKEGIVVFPCLEFRLEAQNERNERINQHILFRDDLDYSEIKFFLNTLRTNTGNPCASINSRKDAEAAQISSDALFSALKNCYNLKMLKDYVIIGCPYGYGGFRPSTNASARDKATAIELDKESHLFFSSEHPERDKDFYLHFMRYEKCIPKPVSLASDAHKNEDIGKKFTWIKGAPSFSALLQSIYSPDERTAFGDYAPDDLKDDSLIIDNIEYDGVKLYFNKNINSVIGKRGSGKSNLLKVLTTSLDMGEYMNRIRSDDRVEDDRRFIDEKYPNLKVKWMDGAISDERKVLYIPQGYIGSLSYEDGAKVKERDDFITSILMNNESFANAERSIKQHIVDVNNSIDGIVERLFEIVEERKNTVDLIKTLGDEVSLKKQFENLANKIEVISKIADITKEELKHYTDSVSEKELLLKNNLLSSKIYRYYKQLPHR